MARGESGSIVGEGEARMQRSNAVAMKGQDEGAGVGATSP
jgi:hypothetical protein